MIIVNVLGGLMMVVGLAAAFAVGGLVDAIWPNANKGVAVGGGVFFLVCFVADLTYRWRNFRERGRWRFVHPLTGGTFFFVPIWIVFGFVPLVVMPVILILFPPKNDPPRRVAAVMRPPTLEPSWNSASSGRPASPYRC